MTGLTLKYVTLEHSNYICICIHVLVYNLTEYVEKRAQKEREKNKNVWTVPPSLNTDQIQ